MKCKIFVQFLICFYVISAGKTELIKCQYLSNKDKVLFSSGQSVCVRKDLNGVLLLDTALQASASKTDDNVKVEMPLPDVSILTYKTKLWFILFYSAFF